MDMKDLEDRASELVKSWGTHLVEDRQKVIAEIRKAGLLAIMVFDTLPPRDQTNDRNELAFGSMEAPAGGGNGDGGAMDIMAISDRAEELAGLWNARTVEGRAQVLKEVHEDGVLAMWVFDLLPAMGKSDARFELANSLMALTDLMREGEA